MTHKLVAVTGANGFVGSALCKHLEQLQIPVRPIVRRKADFSQNQLEVGDIGPNTDWTEALSGVTCVIHCAARVHQLNDSSVDPLVEYRKVNLEGTAALIEQAAAAGVGRFILLSSAKVNGEITIGSDAFFSTDDVEPTDPYALSKYEAERVVMKFASRSGLEVVIVRPPLIYGPGVKANFHNLVSLVYAGLPLPLALIRNKRSLIGIDNLVDVLTNCICHTAAPGQIFLVSDNRDLSTSELVSVIANALNKKALLIPVPLFLLQLAGKLFGQIEKVDRLTTSMVLNIDHTIESLNWNPPVRIEDGIEKTVLRYLHDKRAAQR
jgi:nucleoside-diphosphate-sugar epimerase